MALASIDEAAALAAVNSERDAAFAARRLSVHNPYDEDWNDMGEEDEGGDYDRASTTKASAGAAQRP